MAEALGCATEPILNGEIVIFTGRSLAGDWVVS
jgi:hypothetical protein